MENNPVLRVIHLDTHELDESLLERLKQTLSQDLFKYTRTDFIHRYQPEIFAALKFALWYHTYYKNGQSVAQSLLDWSYPSKRGRLVTLLHGCLYCLDEWFSERMLTLIRSLLVYFYDKFYRASDLMRRNFAQKLDKVLVWLKMSFSWLSLLNYLVFLVNGKYLHLWERLLGFTVSRTEVLWQAYFSLFKLLDSLFDLDRVYRRVTDATGLTRPAQNLSRESSPMTTCAICHDEPTMVHVAANYTHPDACKHVYCYICLRRALEQSNNKYTCRTCSRTIYNCEMFINNKS